MTLYNIFQTSVADSLTITATLSVILTSFLLGLFISIVYIKTRGKEGYQGSFAITLVLLPIIVSVVLLLVGNNVAKAFSLAGAFSLVRFRSNLEDPRDIAYVFFAAAIGLASGMGYIAYAAVFAVLLCIIILVLTFTKYGQPKTPQMQLKITIPEDLDYQNLFDDTFDKFLISATLTRIKTADFGALFELIYSISMKEAANQKAFIDTLRCKNNNLNIVLTTKEFANKIYN